VAKRRSSEHLKAQKQGKDRDLHTCQICGDSNKVQGHHIIDVQFNGSANKDNIVSLCDDHHKKVHAGKLSITKF